MKNFYKRYKTYFILGVASIIICVPLFVLLSASNFLSTSPDMLRIISGVRGIEQTGEIQQNISQTNGVLTNKRDSNILYPQLQILTFVFSQISGVESYLVMHVFSFVLVISIFLLSFLVLRKIYQHDAASLFGALMIVFSLSVARSVVLTPQSLFGFVFILLSLYFFLDHISYTQKKYAWLCFFSLLSLLLFHHLSFFIFIPSIFAYLIFHSKKKVLVFIAAFISVLVGVLFLVFVLEQGHIINDLLGSIRAPTEDNIVNANSIIDLPAQVGYVFFLVGMIGVLFFKKDILREHRGFISIFLVITFFFSYMHFFGIYFFPDRLILYLVFPLSLFIPSTYLFLQKYLFRYLFYVIILFVFLAQVIHFSVYMKDDFEFFSKAYLPIHGEYALPDPEVIEHNN